MSTMTPTCREFTDDFRGDDVALLRSIEALLHLDAENALVPHGIGGHARGLLNAAASRLQRNTRANESVDVVVTDEMVHRGEEAYDKHALANHLTEDGGWKDHTCDPDCFRVAIEAALGVTK